MVALAADPRRLAVRACAARGIKTGARNEELG
jgi:hypothetical protein